MEGALRSSVATPVGSCGRMAPSPRTIRTSDRVRPSPTEWRRLEVVRRPATDGSDRGRRASVRRSAARPALDVLRRTGSTSSDPRRRSSASRAAARRAGDGRRRRTLGSTAARRRPGSARITLPYGRRRSGRRDCPGTGGVRPGSGPLRERLEADLPALPGAGRSTAPTAGRHLQGRARVRRWRGHARRLPRDRDAFAGTCRGSEGRPGQRGPVAAGLGVPAGAQQLGHPLLGARAPRGGSGARAAARPGRRAARRRAAPAPRRASSGSGLPAQRHSSVRSFGSTEKQMPWSTPYTWPSGIGMMCPPLRSALFTTASNTAMRRSAGSSRAHERGQVDRLVAVDPELHHARAERARRAAPSAARRPSRWPPRRGRPRSRGRPACRRGSPRAAAPPPPACRRTRPSSVAGADRAEQGHVRGVEQPALEVDARPRAAGAAPRRRPPGAAGPARPVARSWRSRRVSGGSRSAAGRRARRGRAAASTAGTAAGRRRRRGGRGRRRRGRPSA